MTWLWSTRGEVRALLLECAFQFARLRPVHASACLRPAHVVE